MSKKLTFWQKITLWIVWIYTLILFVWWFLSNCIIWREEPTIWQCTSNQLNMAVTLWINEMAEFMQKRLERKVDKINNKLEDLASWSWVINSTWNLKIPIIEPNVTFESWVLKLNPELKLVK